MSSSRKTWLGTWAKGRGCGNRSTTMTQPRRIKITNPSTLWARKRKMKILMRGQKVAGSPVASFAMRKTSCSHLF
ncbi:hypothetical protein AB205_0094220 [Aquarana catesbeiana]|uniref:Uncharacterized protein n=1 Tax=Aquarana catesbeiana TaxID=8400 RepID=A0A2G9SEI0_AQUCT|nr:hypothetical protein AB205_0094220 [Aquarana catesbeiana]